MKIKTVNAIQIGLAWVAALAAGTWLYCYYQPKPSTVMFNQPDKLWCIGRTDNFEAGKPVALRDIECVGMAGEINPQQPLTLSAEQCQQAKCH